MRSCILFCLSSLLLHDYFLVVDAAKILVYCPSISKSHVLLCSKYADLLHNAAHDTVLFIPSYSSLLNDYDGARHAKVWRLHNVTEAFDKELDSLANVMDDSHIGFIDRLTFDVDFWMESCEDLVKQIHRLQHLKDYNFDLAIYNDIDPCSPAVVRWLNINKTVLLSSEAIMDKISWDLGLPTLPSYVPSVEENPNHDRMSFIERMSNVYKHFQSIVVHYLQERRVLHLFRKYISLDYPPITEIIRNVSLVLVNSDEIFDLSRPYSQKFVYVGMIGSEKNNDVLPELSIYNAIQNLPDYHFVIKTTPEHKNLKLFVSHGGMNSVLETMYYGVPMVIMPVFTDQFRNGKNVERRGVGKVILRHTVVTETFYKVIKDVLNDETYEKSAKRLSNMMKTRPFTPEERVSKWINFVLDHDTFDNFHLESNNLSFIEHNQLDVFCVFIVLPLITYYVFKRILSNSYSK
uniref:glucuronosyltransferase n=1 Tax=Caenorhabditis tropicalis TaxID=1561998 RepID=A0A1I7US59_9PELO